MITAIIIDDEKDAQEVLQLMLLKHCSNIKVLACCSNAAQGIDAIKKCQPNLIFLDVEMPVQNGFDVLNAFAEKNFNVIFTTAYNQFAIKAIKYAAFDYLLKPIDANDLKESINRLQKQPSDNTQQQFQLLMHQIQKANLPQKIALHTTEGLQFVNPNEIIRGESLSNYTKIYLLNGQKILLSKTLKEVEEILEPYNFYRIHNSFVVNLNHITKYIRTDGNYIEMTDGEHISVARNRKEGFIEKFSTL